MISYTYYIAGTHDIMKTSSPIITHRYDQAKNAEWDCFVKESRNGTFLFERNYMDYHSDRFEDNSLLFYDSCGKLLAVLPANRVGKTLHSHQGLTYGGLITKSDAGTEVVCRIFSSMNQHLKSMGIERVRYKAIPWIYHTVPAEEDLYAITTTCDAHLVCREISSAIPLQNRMRWTEERRRGIRRAEKAGITVGQSESYEGFWDVLTRNLQDRYGVRPVHSLSEIALLHSHFPENIRLYTAKKDGKVVAGIVTYNTRPTVHVQYISASPEGKRYGALDMLFHHVIEESAKEFRYFDFGKSTEDEGRYLNTSLIHQKEGFGARGVCYDTYEWEL